MPTSGKPISIYPSAEMHAYLKRLAALRKQSMASCVLELALCGIEALNARGELLPARETPDEPPEEP